MLHVYHKIEQLINKHKTTCPFKLAKAMNIHVIYEPLGSIKGYYSKHFRIKFIHINETATEEQQLFICAHELGHAVLSPNVNTSFLKKFTLHSTDKIENEANYFALSLLSKSEELNQLSIGDAIDDYAIPEYSIKMFEGGF